MSDLATNEIWSIFDARRVKAPELHGLDAFVNAIVGLVRNRLPVLSRLRAQAERVEAMEPEIKNLSDARFAETVVELRQMARTARLTGPFMDRALAVAREAAFRTVGQRPFMVQIMGASAMIQGYVIEMATGEGKTLTASLSASIMAWAGRPVHVITVNDYLVARDAELMGPVYEKLGLHVGHVEHETTPQERIDHYRRNVVYVTSKELVADFLRDQIVLGTIRSSTQLAVGLMAATLPRSPMHIPGLFRVIVDEADSLLVDEAVTPLIISDSPDDEANATHYRAAYELAQQLERDRDFTIDRPVRHCDLTNRGQNRLDQLVGDSGFWKGRRRREELVTQALSAIHCYTRDEQYLLGEENDVQIIDEFTGRVMADRSWRHGLHQAIEVKENVKVTSDKENLARLSFQRFFRQYPSMAGMTGTAWESAGEFWQIYMRPVVRIPTNKPCIRTYEPTRFFESIPDKYDAVVERSAELHERGLPVLVGTRSVLSSQEVSARLAARGVAHRVLNATQTAQEASIIAEAGQRGRITVATNMAGRGTDIILGKGIADLGGLQVLSTEPATSARVDRQLFGRSARQGDPGSAQMFASKDDDLFLRHADRLRQHWRTLGADRLIKIAQFSAERLARFHRKQVLQSDDWMDHAVPF
jgi:preprotein translocase subunit SecA